MLRCTWGKIIYCCVPLLKQLINDNTTKTFGSESVASPGLAIRAVAPKIFFLCFSLTYGSKYLFIDPGFFIPKMASFHFWSSPLIKTWARHIPRVKKFDHHLHQSKVFPPGSCFHTCERASYPTILMPINRQCNAPN